MKSIKVIMGLLMGVTLSLCLSFVGTFTSGSFTVPSFIISFFESLVISFVIGLFVPMKDIERNICIKAGVREKPFARRALGSLVSDLIYTPVITVAMVTLAYFHIPAPHRPPYPVMLGKSMLISLVVAYLIIFLVTDKYMGIAMKVSGEGGPPQRPEK